MVEESLEEGLVFYWKGDIDSLTFFSFNQCTDIIIFDQTGLSLRAVSQVSNVVHGPFDIELTSNTIFVLTSAWIFAK